MAHDEQRGFDEWMGKRRRRVVAEVIGGGWLQFDKGNCLNCSSVSVWLYAPEAEPMLKVCRACAMASTLQPLLRLGC